VLKEAISTTAGLIDTRASCTVTCTEQVELVLPSTAVTAIVVTPTGICNVQSPGVQMPSAAVELLVTLLSPAVPNANQPA
jgi:hypothetical protein